MSPSSTSEVSQESVQEQERLQALHRLNILDTDIHEELSGLVSLASNICDTEISLINLLDSHRQVTKARTGWNIEEIPKEESFCQYTITGDDLMIIENAVEDDRFKESPFVKGEPNIRFYAGMPLITEDGNNLGALCVIDSESRNLNEKQKESLRLLADEVMARFKLVQEQEKLEEKNTELEKTSIFMQNSSDIQAIINKDSLKILEVNDEVKKVLGYEAKALRGREFGTHISDKQLQNSVRNFLRHGSPQKDKQFTIPVTTKTGNTIYLQLSFTHDNNLWYLTARDITKQRKAEDELTNTLNILSRSQEIASVGSWEVDLKKNESIWSDETYRILGYDKENSSADIERWKKAIHPDDKERIMSGFKSLMTGHEVEAEHQIISHTDGRIKYVNERGVPEFDDEGNLIKISGTIQDITDRKEYERKLEQQSKAIESSADGIAILDTENNFSYMNESHASIFGYDKAELVGNRWEMLYIRKEHDRFKEIVEQELNENYSWRGEATGRRKNGQQFPLEISLSKTTTGELICVAHDITDRKKLQDNLLEEKRLNEKIINSLPAEFFMYDTSNNIIRWNENLLKTTGYNPQELAYMDPTEYFPEKERKGIRDEIQKAFNTGSAKTEATLLTKSGREVPYLFNVSLFKTGKKTYLLGTGQDISDLKKVEDELKKSLNQKKVLLSEVHHRVKNNLAVISGLLQLERFKSSNKALKKKLLDSEMRIQSMARIHELLYKSKDFSKLHFQDFVKEIIISLRHLNRQNEKEIDLISNTEDIHLNINQAIPCALILNELIGNAFDHAFENRKSGSIQISVFNDNEIIFLQVRDNGVGLPRDFDVNQSDTLGFTLINTLCEQLEAECDFEIKDGTIFNIRFSRESVKGSGSAASNL